MIKFLGYVQLTTSWESGGLADIFRSLTYFLDPITGSPSLMNFSTNIHAMISRYTLEHRRFGETVRISALPGHTFLMLVIAH